MRIKLAKVYLTQEEFRNGYLLFKETIKNEMKDVMNSMKKDIHDINLKLLSLEERAKKLIFLRSKFNSEYLDETNKNKIILFTKYFLNLFDSVNKLKKDII